MQTVLTDNRLEAKENMSVSIGTLWLVRHVFRALELNTFLDSLKRSQGIRFSVIVQALVAYSIQSRGISVLEFNRLVDDPILKSIYGLPESISLNDLYRAIDRLGQNINAIQRHIVRVLKKRFKVTLKNVYVDWSSSYIDGKSTLFVRFGHSKDHRPDRPQINYGIVVDALSKLPMCLTVSRGNINDNLHFRRSYGLIRRFLPKGAVITFDAGANSKKNKDLMVRDGFNFLTRSNINASDMQHLDLGLPGWTVLRDGTMAYRYDGNQSYHKTLFFSEKRKGETMEGYRRKAARDYDEMEEMAIAIKKGDPPRKKYRSSNCFVDTELRIKPEFMDMTREEAVKAAVEGRVTGKEGYFLLVSSFKEDEQATLDRYRNRNVSEDHYLDLKTGIRIRPLRGKKDESLRGRVLIVFLGLFCVCFARFLTKELRDKTAETVIDEVRQLSLTLVIRDGTVIDRIQSNFTPLISAIDESFHTFPGLFKAVSDEEKPQGRGFSGNRLTDKSGPRNSGIMPLFRHCPFPF